MLELLRDCKLLRKDCVVHGYDLRDRRSGRNASRVKITLPETGYRDLTFSWFSSVIPGRKAE
jgi:hypothetical protein